MSSKATITAVAIAAVVIIAATAVVFSSFNHSVSDSRM